MERASIPIAVKINACGTSFPINATIIEPFPASNHSLEVLGLIYSLILYTVVNITNIQKNAGKMKFAK